MPCQPINLEAVRQAEARLVQLLLEHPELREPSPERQHALDAWLTETFPALPEEDEEESPDA